MHILRDAGTACVVLVGMVAALGSPVCLTARAEQARLGPLATTDLETFINLSGDQAMAADDRESLWIPGGPLVTPARRLDDPADAYLHVFTFGAQAEPESHATRPSALDGLFSGGPNHKECPGRNRGPSPKRAALWADKRYWIQRAKPAGSCLFLSGAGACRPGGVCCRVGGLAGVGVRSATPAVAKRARGGPAVADAPDGHAAAIRPVGRQGSWRAGSFKSRFTAPPPGSLTRARVASNLAARRRSSACLSVRASGARRYLPPGACLPCAAPADSRSAKRPLPDTAVPPITGRPYRKR